MRNILIGIGIGASIGGGVAAGITIGLAQKKKKQNELSIEDSYSTDIGRLSPIPEIEEVLESRPIRKRRRTKKSTKPKKVSPEPVIQKTNNITLEDLLEKQLEIGFQYDRVKELLTTLELKTSVDKLLYSYVELLNRDPGIELPALASEALGNLIRAVETKVPSFEEQPTIKEFVKACNDAWANLQTNVQSL